MKLRRTKVKHKRFFELHLIKSKIYEQPIKKNISENLPDVNLSNIILNFKKALQVIFKYHKNNKQILFLGTPKRVELILNSKTPHAAFSDLFNIRRLQLSKSIISSIKLNNQTAAVGKDSILFKLENKPDLIVVFDQNLENSNYQSIIKDAQSNRIPIIKFNSSLQERYWRHCYGVPGNFNVTATKSVDNIFFIIVNSMLKNSNTTR